MTVLAFCACAVSPDPPVLGFSRGTRLQVQPETRTLRDSVPSSMSVQPSAPGEDCTGSHSFSQAIFSGWAAMRKRLSEAVADIF